MEAEDHVEKCALCERPLGDRWNKHHLIPRTFKGKQTVNLHLICHHKIHSVFRERELLNHYHTIERLQAHEEIARFLKWIAKKEPNYFDRNRRLKR